MKQNLLIISFTFLCNFFVTCLSAQVRLSMEVTPAVINKDQQAILKIIAEECPEIIEIIPPSMHAFTVTGGPYRENGMRSLNGLVKKYTVLSFQIKPKYSGTISINPATVKTKSGKWNTNAVNLRVLNTVSVGTAGTTLARSGNHVPGRGPRELDNFKDYILQKGESVRDKVNRNMQLRIETDKTTCFVGEPVKVQYKLYTRLKSESRLVENPSFNGFSVIDLTDQEQQEYKKEKLEGREYNVYTIRKVQLYPLQAGSISLESAELENRIRFVNVEFATKYDQDLLQLLDGYSGIVMPGEGFIDETVILRNKPVSIDVKALPPGSPAEFSGAVGNFTMEAVMQKESFPANETGKLTVKISGAGNMQMLIAPVVIWPAAAEPFDPEVELDSDMKSVPVKGSKTFDFAFSVGRKGSYTLQPIVFCFFDPVTATYKRIQSKPLSFNVTESVDAASYNMSEVKKAEPVSGINRIFVNRWWIIVALILIVLSVVVFWMIRDKIRNNAAIISEGPKLDQTAELERMLSENRKNPLEKTAACLNSNKQEGFYKQMNAELKDFLAMRLEADLLHINTKNISNLLDVKKISIELSIQIQNLLEEIEWELYTPDHESSKKELLYNNAQNVIQQLNACLFKRL